MNIASRESLSTLLALRDAHNTSSQRAAIVAAEHDPRAAIAYAIAVVNGEHAPDRVEALEALADRVAVLKHGDSPDALEELAAHLPLLEAQWLSLTIQAATTRNTDAKVRLTKLSLQCQSAFARTLALVAALKMQRDNKASVFVHGDANAAED